MSGINQVVTVGDKVRLTRDLMGTVRFVGEIQKRNGIFYGIELTEPKGKSNGMVDEIRYFKCKNKRGLFLRLARIQEIFASATMPRIGINDCISVQMASSRSSSNKGVVRYIGVPPKCKDVYYGIQFKDAIGDSDGAYHGTQYFTTKKKHAYFVKAASSHIIDKIENEQQPIKQKTKTKKTKHKKKANTSNRITNGANATTQMNTISNGGTSDANAAEIKQIELEIYCETNEDVEGPIFAISILSNFSYSELVCAISRMSQYVSSVFHIRFEPLSSTTTTTNGHNTNTHNGHNTNAHNGYHKKATAILTDQQLSLLRSHSFNFYDYGKFFVIEPLKKGIIFEEKGEFSAALKIYENAVRENNESTEALTYFANCLVLLDKFDEAEENYRKALDINPFCGDICYFYSRLLEYRDKYDEAKNLCNRIMNYVKTKKSSHPQAHHAIHYSCYARLGTKYIKLSLDRYNRSKLSVQEKLKRVIVEKQKEIENNENVNINKLKQLNQTIAKLEKQLLKKEEIIKNKDKELNTKQNEIKLLKNKLQKLQNNNNNNDSAAKLLSQNIINDKQITKPFAATATAAAPKEQKSKPAKVKATATKQEAKETERDMLSEYMPLFTSIETKKKAADNRRDKLRNGLLAAETLSSLTDCSDDKARQLLMKDKLELCAVVCDFNNTHDGRETNRIENKKDLLLEVLQCMSGNKWNNIELLQQCIETIWHNLFRSLPSPEMIKTDANDDEMDFRDPSWDHLQLIYELTFHVVTNTHIDKKTMKKHLQGAFLQNLIHLFSSADDREPQYVKIIVHAIYGRFMALRKAIRKHLSDYCYQYIYLSRMRDQTSWQGLPEILEIFCSIFQGLNVPVKPDYHIVLRNVIVPLHKSFHLDEFHEQLLQCCTQFVTKDPESAPVILGGILKFWPHQSPLKEQLFITEIVHILNVCVRHPSLKQSDPGFATITIAVLNKFVACMTSPHHQVAERSLMVWRDETVRICVDLHREKIWPNIYKALQENKEKYWLSAIRNINRQIMSDFKRRDPEFFEKIEKQQQSQDVCNNNDIQQKEAKKQSREQRWIQLRQLAKPKSNK